MIHQSQKFSVTPIHFKYLRPDSIFIESIKKYSKPAEIRPAPRLSVENSYFKMGIQGALEVTYLRGRPAMALNEALQVLPSDYGLVVFDGYRSRETQSGLFLAYSQQIKEKNPNFSEEELYRETRKYVAHPDEPSRFEVPPHISGGAVDIGLTDRAGNILDMGTPFDDLTERSATDFFEAPFDRSFGFTEKQWIDFRVRRRILFHSLVSVGFTNWPHEWWHFDMGNCVWSNVIGLPWIYNEMAIS